jgi:methionyl-tRNA synthetase
MAKKYTTSPRRRIRIKTICNKYAQRVMDFCKLFNVEYDNFYRTSDPKHMN